MKMLRTVIVLFTSFVMVAYATAAEAPDEAAQIKHLLAARQLMTAGSPENVLTEIEPVIKYYEEKYSHEPAKVYCSRSNLETTAYLLLHTATGNGKAIVIGVEWSMAYYIKSYALVEQGSLAEARQSLAKAIELAPFNSFYLCEMGHIYQAEKNWTEALKTFELAEQYTRDFTPEDVKGLHLARSLRGQGYTLIALGKLNEAETKYRECLKLDARDQMALDELKYIRVRKDVSAITGGHP
jgi:tetratricopeptide (TPR) repeat protein